ncbi:FtsB family cell division protein [Rubrobacter indicoceani]|uniref:FtsB family cell division protein n=1 Tax=Rubrobacter indicoceani TaxID=2051957 RepID=UPI0013C42995|nr:septum formation initiator family protein [Rubrobacter indicoceani]
MVAYAAFIGLLLASYIAPLKDTLKSRAEMPEVEARLAGLEADVAAREAEVRELQTPAGIERAARERYGMVAPGEKVYMLPDEAASE